MTRVTLKLAKGDWVVHNNHGLGEIIGIEMKERQGNQNLFYMIKTQELTYWLPAIESSSERVRPIADAKTFAQALKLAAGEPEPMDNNYRQRLAAIHARVQDCSLLVKAALIRDIHARNVQKDIHINEKSLLELLTQQFIHEWVVACKINENEARAELREALKESSVHLKPKKSPF
jgi:RNA polymerase-interacting CarD/CdnL/TRCF family regulator